MPKAKTPNKKAGKGADRNANGTFKKGTIPNPNGRPRGIDFRRVCEEKAAAEGYDLEDAVWEMTKNQIEAAKTGDVGAYKAVLDRLCGAIKQELEMSGAQTVHIADEARALFRRIAADKGFQQATLDRLEEMN